MQSKQWPELTDPDLTAEKSISIKNRHWILWILLRYITKWTLNQKYASSKFLMQKLINISTGEIWDDLKFLYFNGFICKNLSAKIEFMILARLRNFENTNFFKEFKISNTWHVPDLSSLPIEHKVVLCTILPNDNWHSSLDTILTFSLFNIGLMDEAENGKHCIVHIGNLALEIQIVPIFNTSLRSPAFYRMYSRNSKEKRCT